MTSVQTVQEETAREVAANKLCIILSKGSLDMVYPAFMLATTGATMGMDVHVFFTFWGMEAVSRKKYQSLKLASVGNPALPMPTILGVLPGMTAMATRMIKGKIEKVKLPPIPEMIKTAKHMGIKLHACSTTMDVMGLKREDLIDEVDDVVGAGTFLDLSHGAQTLFI